METHVRQSYVWISWPKNVTRFGQCGSIENSVLVIKRETSFFKSFTDLESKIAYSL